MSQLCVTPKCQRTSRADCDCCRQPLCLQHLNEHNAKLMLQLNPLTDDLNSLNVRLKAIDVFEITHKGRQQLEQWRKDCHEEIDRLFQTKCHELDRLIADRKAENEAEGLRIRSKIDQHISNEEVMQQNIDLLTLEIVQLKAATSQIEQTQIQIDVRPLIIDSDSIKIREVNEQEIDLKSISHTYKCLKSPIGTYIPLASNNDFLLIHEKPNLCLIDRESNIVRRTLCNSNMIMDMCWSSTLGQFIVIGKEHILFIDAKTMFLNRVNNSQNRSWCSCTCSRKSLFLSTNEKGSSIVEMTLLPSIDIVNEWKRPVTCAENEFINRIAFEDDALAMVVNDSGNLVRIELRSCKTLDRIWSLSLNIVRTQKMIFSCCSLRLSEWLVTDYENKRLLHITKDGKLKASVEYDEIPWCAEMFGSDILVVRAGRELRFYKF
ncbi:unnamed protein product [Adineta ricciae]|uniref:B box-type domain-containing protein n=1 Tax=Adineta ricciae TaxID=249248 RepID=A0A814HVT0_ADIRI|nr:unnamed protein product [Adineta ricciae]